MIELALWTCCAAAAVGLALGVLYLRSSAPIAAIPVLHGALGAASFAILLFALDHARPRRAMGTAGFGRFSAGLLALALALGLAIAWTGWRRRRPPGALVGAHAAFAIAGLVVLLALVALG